MLSSLLHYFYISVVSRHSIYSPIFHLRHHSSVAKHTILSAFSACLCVIMLMLAAPAALAAENEYTTDNNCADIDLNITKHQLGDTIFPIEDYSNSNYIVSTVYKAFSLTRVPPGICPNDVYADAPCESYCDNTSSRNITFCYDTADNPATGIGTCPNAKLYTLAPSQDITIANDWFQAILINNTICVQVYSHNDWITLGCKQAAPASTLNTNSPSECYVDPSCADKALGHSQTFFSPSSMVVECIKETLEHIFLSSSNCPGRTNLFSDFQKIMRKAIGAALILYVIFFSMRIVIGAHLPSKGETFWFALKMILVVYFSIGNGVQTFLYPVFVESMIDISYIMFEAGDGSYDADGNVVERGLCHFKDSDYPKEYRYVALFDSIDCRIGHYLLLSNKSVPMVVVMILPLLFSGQTLMCIFSMMFGIFILSVLVFVVHSFIISLIILTLVMYFAPLFVPMALFSYTKKYYDNWIKSLLFGMLQPLVLFACVALMLTIFDQMFYGDCRFSRQHGALGMYTIDKSLSPETCKDSMGYRLNVLVSDKQSLKLKGGFIQVFKFTPPDDVEDLMLNMMILSLFCFLFYHFLTIVVNMAEDLMGGPQAQALVSTTPMGVANWTASKVGGAMQAGVGSFGGGSKPRDDAQSNDSDDAPDGDAPVEPSAPPEPK